MKEQLVYHGEILPPGTVPERRDTHLVINQFFIEEHPSPLFFLSVHTHKQDFGEEVMDALLGGLERLAIRAVRASLTRVGRLGCPDSS